MRRTKIVATIGPASESPAMLRSLIEAGVDVARIGLAHGSLDEHLEKYRNIRSVAADMGKDIGILADLPGPKVRCAPFPEGGAVLVDGSTVRFTAGEKASNAEVISADYEGLVDDIDVGDQLALGDGNIVFTVNDKDTNALSATVIRGGLAQGRPGLQVPSERLRISTPTPADFTLADAFIEAGVDMLAISFVRSAHDVRSLGVEAAPRGPLVVAKIETKAAVTNLEGIIEASGAVMVARGDLGIDFPLSELPHLQKHIIRRCVALGRPVITATQMLESMVYAPAPTRAEASDVANAVFDGSSAVMLSGETAIGVDPVNAVRTMAEITIRADENFDHRDWVESINALRVVDGQTDFGAVTTDALTLAAVKVADQLDAKAILCLSKTGFTVRSVNRFRPQTRILAFSPDERAVRQLSLSWGTEAAVTTMRADAWEVITDALELTASHFGLDHGAKVVVISGQSTATRATDTLRVMRVP
jgi:pyruvate kinase